MAEPIIPVILCGGAGARLWPASRESFPKQLIAFSGDRSLLQETLLRVTGEGFGKPVIVTGNDTRFLVAEQVRALGIEADILLEPMRRDSCAAVLAGTCHVEARSPGAMALVLAADHAIPDIALFRETVSDAAAAARAGHLLTFGIVPNAPATGYGYIAPGAALDGMAGARAVARFIEKPDAATAAELVASGHVWNSGNFLFLAHVMLAEAERLAPEVLGPVRQAHAQARQDLDFLRLAEAPFAQAKSISVDYAIMEKSDRLAVMPSRFGWSDIGSWDAAWEMSAKDEAGNGGHGNVRFQASRNSYAYSTGPLTALIGVDDVVAVTTRDAVLVVSRKHAQDVKKLVAALQSEGSREATEHLRMYRPWGDYEQIDRGARYQVKRITVKPGGILSLQSHFHRAEHWVVVTGTARVTIGDTVRLVSENESIYVPLGAVHRMENPGQVPLELIEVQSGSYLGEDDIVRYEDIYNRS